MWSLPEGREKNQIINNTWTHCQGKVREKKIIFTGQGPAPENRMCLLLDVSIMEPQWRTVGNGAEGGSINPLHRQQLLIIAFEPLTFAHSYMWTKVSLEKLHHLYWSITYNLSNNYVLFSIAISKKIYIPNCLIPVRSLPQIFLNTLPYRNLTKANRINVKCERD